MRVEVIMPRMGQGMEEGTVLQWLKPVGELVKRGEPLIEIESDKANVEIEAFAAGRLVEIVATEGTTVPIGGILGFIEVEQQSAQPEIATPSPAPAVHRRVISPVAQRLAQEHQLNLEAITGTGPGGRIVREDIEAAVARGKPQPVRASRLDVSPVARKMAGEHGLDLYQIRGSAPNGRIIKRDILAAVAQMQPTLPAQATPSGQHRTPLSKIRRAAAARMIESKTTIPHFYLTLDVNTERALLLRESLQRRGYRVSINDLVLKAAALALAQYPVLNATYDAGDLILHESVNLAIAVAVGERKHPEGLITPVIHGCERLRLVEIAERAAAISARVREGKPKAEDLDGGNFTVSNLGMFGIRQFQAIINPPQVAILAVGALQKVPIFDEQDRVIARQQLTVTLSADHRATDGAEAAGFLAAFQEAFEDGFVLAE